MLTRLYIDGFKNLHQAEISFSPFTCIAGANGVGKSNLFDAILFLRDLSEYTLAEAVARVRDPSGRSDILSVFWQTAEHEWKPIIFEADFLTPKEIEDDFGQKALPSASYLRYRLELRFAPRSEQHAERIILHHESLHSLGKKDAGQLLGFSHSKEFLQSLIIGKGGRQLITTSEDINGPTINLHQDQGSGRTFRIPANNSPKTILSGINTDSHPTILAARREMQSWMLMQLEPSALRQPDRFHAQAQISPNGAHLPATLLRLKAEARVTNALSELIDDIWRIEVDQDESRRLYTLVATTHDGVRHSAQALSDGTLRFLALAILSEDSEAGRLICLEEPENGIHPLRIPVMLQLLQSIAVDPHDAISPDDNPLRQVIINTHSPGVVRELPKDSLILIRKLRQKGNSLAEFRCLPGTWRSQKNSPSSQTMPSCNLSEILAYLENPPESEDKDITATNEKQSNRNMPQKIKEIDWHKATQATLF